MVTVIRKMRPPALGLAAFLLAAADAGAANAQSLQERIEICGTCHGATGNSEMEKIPSLAGQPPLFVTNQLILMREGIRVVEPMAQFVKDLKDDAILALAEHYAKLTPVASKEPVDPALAKRGGEVAAATRCASCHLPSFAGREQIPRLAKQRVDVLVEAMLGYRDNRRKGSDTSMNGAMYGISDADITALAHFLASR